MKILIFIWLLLFELFVSGCMIGPGRAEVNFKQYEPVRGGKVTYQLWTLGLRRNTSSVNKAKKRAQEFCGGDFRVVSEESYRNYDDDAFVRVGFVCEAGWQANLREVPDVAF